MSSLGRMSRLTPTVTSSAACIPAQPHDPASGGEPKPNTNPEPNNDAFADPANEDRTAPPIRVDHLPSLAGNVIQPETPEREVLGNRRSCTRVTASGARKMPPNELIKRQQCPIRANVEVVEVDTQELAPLLVGGAEVRGGASASTRVDKNPPEQQAPGELRATLGRQSIPADRTIAG
jgi:hypothetical protein